MIRRLDCRVSCCTIAGLWLSVALTHAETIDLRPIADTFVVNPATPPVHSTMDGIQDADFGGAGSRGVAAAAAHVSTATPPDNKAHGYYRSLLRFDASSTEGDDILSATLQLYTTRDMNGAKSMFNPKAQSGYFTVSLLRLPETNEWVEGDGAPEAMSSKRVYDPTLGTTHNILDNLILPAASITELTTLYFDASLLGTDPNVNQKWYNYDLTCPALENALSMGGEFTLLLSPAHGDNTVSFNFQCRNQINSQGVAPTIWATGPHLLISAVPEPNTAILLGSALLGAVAIGIRRYRNTPGRSIVAVELYGKQ
jgi:hypothetical protein